MFWSVLLPFFFVRRPVQPTEETNLNINFINQTLGCAIKKADEKARADQPSRNRKLSCASVIRLLIGAQGGSLAKELHRADINATPAAVSQRRAQTDNEDGQKRYIFLQVPKKAAQAQRRAGVVGTSRVLIK